MFYFNEMGSYPLATGNELLCTNQRISIRTITIFPVVFVWSVCLLIAHDMNLTRGEYSLLRKCKAPDI